MFGLRTSQLEILLLNPTSDVKVELKNTLAHHIKVIAWVTPRIDLCVESAHHLFEMVAYGPNLAEGPGLEEWKLAQERYFLFDFVSFHLAQQRLEIAFLHDGELAIAFSDYGG
jgi:hypothetical protein